MSGVARAVRGPGWRNWSGSVRFTPRRLARPESIEEVVALVRAARDAGETLRVAGAGHSFTPLAVTEGTLVSLDGFHGLLAADPAAGQATVRAGTRLRALGDALLGHGAAPENLGDIDAQSIAGATSTGTHGTGAALGGLAAQVTGLTLVTGVGDVVECSEKSDPDLLSAARVSLGALGVIVLVTLRVLPAYRLRYRSERMRLDEVVADLDRHLAEHRHFEFYAFPYSPWVQAKWQDPTEEPARDRRLRAFVNDEVMENAAVWTLCAAARAAPRLSARIGKVMGRAVGPYGGVGHAHRVFATPRRVRFNEMEYALPRERLPDVLQEVRATIERRRLRVHFPIEVRFSAGDDIWLSTAYGRDSAYIAVHVFRGMPYRGYFAAMEEIFVRAGGRPQWGKLHSLGAPELRPRYPRWDDVLAARARLDPDGVFLNPHLRHLFGLPGAPGRAD